MAFEKRKHKRVKVRRATDDDVKKTKKTKNDTERIVMKRKDRKPKKSEQKSDNSSATKKESSKFRIIEGGLIRNAKRRTQSIIIAAVTVIIIATVIAANAILPTGLVEWSQNVFSAMGSDGGLPKALSGDKVDDLRSRGNELFVMSDSYMYAYNTDGKCITTVQHGYNSPRLETSFTRTLIYDRGSYGLRVDSLYTNYINTQLDKKIITADICDKGYVAVATDSTEYSAEVTVYDSKFKSLFRWSAASGQVSTLKLSPNGKYLAASVVSGKNGDYSSMVSIFEIKTGSKLFTKVYDGSMFVKSSSDRDFVTFVGIDECVSIGWDGLNERVNDFYRLEYFDATLTNCMAAVYHPDGDDRHYTVAVLDSNGAVKASVVLQGNVARVSADENYIYTYDAGVVNKYDLSGNMISTHQIGYEYVFMTNHKKGIGLTYDMKLDFIS